MIFWLLLLDKFDVTLVVLSCESIISHKHFYESVLKTNEFVWLYKVSKEAAVVIVKNKKTHSSFYLHLMHESKTQKLVQKSP